MKPKAKISVIIGIVLSNIMFANFVSGQTPAAGRGTTPQSTYDALAADTSLVLINPGEYNQINATQDKTKCNIELSNRLYKIPFSWGLFGSGLTHLPLTGALFDKSATWLVARWDETNKECVIYQKNRIGTFDTRTVDDYFNAGYKIEDESGLSVRRGTYYLEHNPFAIDVQTTLMNVSVPLTIANFQQRYEGSSFDDQASGVSKIIGWILNAVLSAVNAFILWVTALVGGIFTTALSWILNSTMPGMVTTGWIIVRDVCNMFFILALIAMALATILQLGEEYNYKHLLPKLVLMALLVNFSKVIATTLVDFVSFLASIFAIHSASEIWAFLYRYVNFGDLNTLPNGWMAGLVQGLSKLLFSFVAAATFIALTSLLVVRIVAIYILIILSPLAYVLNILPFTEHYAKEWWGYFLKNLLWLPVSLLIIKLTILLAHSPEFTASDSAFNVILLMAFLWGAVVVAEHIGAAGSQMVVGMAEKAAKGAGKFALGATDRWLARGAEKTGGGVYNRLRRGASYLSVGAVKRGWQQRAKAKEFEAYTVSAGKRADLFNRVISRETTDFALRGQQARVQEEKKHITTKNREELATHFNEALHDEDPYKALAYAEQMTANYDLNELLGYNGYTTDAKGLTMLVEEKLVPLMGKQAAYRAGYDLSRTAEEANHWNYARVFTGKYDPAKKDIEYDINGKVDRDTQGKITKLDFTEGADKERLIEIGKLERRRQVGASNRLGHGFLETDTMGLNETTGKMEMGRFNVGWDDFGRRRWGTEIADNEARNQFNVNALMNVMLHNSKDAIKLNKSLWIQQVNAKLMEMDPAQIKQWRNRVAKPKMGWAANEAAGQTFVGIETVERYIKEGLLSEDDIREMKDDGKNIMTELAHHRGGSSGPTPTAPTPPTP